MRGATAPVTDPAAMSRWPVACRQWQGARPYQEDDYDLRVLADEPGEEEDAPALLMVLADGMGGEVGGATASHGAVQAFIHHFPETRGAIGARLNECLDAANHGLHAQVTADPRLDGMGCTVVAAHYDGRSLAWLSVGDSPMWLFTGGRLARLNADHSMAPVLDRLAEIGELSPEEALSDGKRNMLRSAVMGGKVELVDCGRRSCRLGPGDYLLLASDGLQTLADHDLERWLHVTDGGVEAAADALLSAVQAAATPGQDNVTFLLLAGAADPALSTTDREEPSRALALVEPAAEPAATGQPKPLIRRVAATLGLAAAVGMAFGLGWWLAPEPEQPPEPGGRAVAPVEDTPEPPTRTQPSGEVAVPPSEPDAGTDGTGTVAVDPEPEAREPSPETPQAETAEVRSGQIGQQADGAAPVAPATSGQPADPPSEPDAGTDGSGTVAVEPEPEARETLPETPQADAAEVRSGEIEQQATEAAPVRPAPAEQAADPRSEPDTGRDGTATTGEPEPRHGGQEASPETPEAVADGLRSGEITQQAAPGVPPSDPPPIEAPAAPATHVPSTER